MLEDAVSVLVAVAAAAAQAATMIQAAQNGAPFCDT